MATHITRRTAASLMVAGLAASRSARAADLAGATLMVGDQKGGSRALMEAAGMLAGVPYAIEWREFPAAAPLLEALNAGAIDTGIVGDAPMIFAQAAGVPLKAIGAWRSDPVGTAIVAPAGSPIRTPVDLKGKRIATGKGSIGHYLVLVALESAGLSASDAEIVFLLPADAKAAFVSGAIDAWSSWDPYTSLVRLVDGATVVADGRGITTGLGFQVANEHAIATKRAVLEDFLGRLAAARAWSLDHTDQFAATLAQLIGIPPEVGREWLGRARTQFVLIDERVVTEQQRTIDNYARFGVIQKRVAAADAFDASFNTAVARYSASG